MWTDILGQIVGSFIGVLAGYFFIKLQDFIKNRNKRNLIKDTKKSLIQYIKILLLYQKIYQKKYKKLCDSSTLHKKRKGDERFEKFGKKFEKKLGSFNETARALIESFLIQNKGFFTKKISIFSKNVLLLDGYIIEKLQILEKTLKTEMHDDEIYEILKSL